jgi:hypothetical protein
MLIRNIDDLKAQLGALDTNALWDTWGPFVEQAQRRHLQPWLGRELLTQLDGYLTGGTQDAALDELLQLLRPAAAYFAQVEALPLLNVRIGEAGIQETSGAGSAAVRQWSYLETQMASVGAAESALEDALAFLEMHPAEYPIWAASPACTLQRDQLFARAGELTRYLNIQGSRRAYLALQPFLQRAEELYVVPVLGYEADAQLRARRIAGTVTPTDLALLKALRRATAQFGLAEAIPELTLNLSAAGLSVVADVYSIRQRIASQQPDTATLATKAEALGQRYLQELREFLEANAAQVPGYAPAATQDFSVVLPMGLTDQENGPAVWV